MVNAAIHEGKDVLEAGAKEGLRPCLDSLLLHHYKGREGGRKGGRVGGISSMLGPHRKSREGGREGGKARK